MIIWLLIFSVFGLVSIEQQSIWPAVFVVLLWLLFSPMQRRLTRESGGLGFFWTVLLAVPGVVLLLAILTSWRGGGL